MPVSVFSRDTLLNHCQYMLTAWFFSPAFLGISAVMVPYPKILLDLPNQGVVTRRTAAYVRQSSLWQTNKEASEVTCPRVSLRLVSQASSQELRVLSKSHQGLEFKNFCRIQEAASWFAHHTLPESANVSATTYRRFIIDPNAAHLSKKWPVVFHIFHLVFKQKNNLPLWY